MNTVKKAVHVPFELTLLRGFKGCSHWTGKMIWDEATQVIIAIDGMTVRTYEVTTGINRYRINKAHEAPVTVALWFSENEYIVTGCMGGLIKIWACQHTNLSKTKRSRRQKRKSKRHTFRRRRQTQSPALITSLKRHSGAITGLVRHCTETSLIVTSSNDGTLRIWDVDRLVPVVVVPFVGAVASLLVHRTPSGRPRLVCTGKEGAVQTMIVHKVCEFLGAVTANARRITYHPPLSLEEAGSDSVAAPCGRRVMEGIR